jgi:hypothetical protein
MRDLMAHSFLTSLLLTICVCLFRQLNLSNNCLCGVWDDNKGRLYGDYTSEGINAIADAFRVNGALTVTNLLGNKLDEESARMLAEVAKQKGISLCGIRRDQTTADFSRQGLNPILLASDLSQAVGLTSLNLSSTDIGGYWDDILEEIVSTPEGPKAIADALLLNGAIDAQGVGDCSDALCGVGAMFVAIAVSPSAAAQKVSGKVDARQRAADENRVSLSPQIQT